MRKLDLVNSIEDRNEVMTIENETKVLEILKRLGDIVDYMTEPMVAEFYRVDKEAITSIGRRNKEELSNYGYKVYSKSEIKNTLNGQVDHLENIPNRGLRLYPIKAVLVIGMLLTESKVAEDLRNEIVKELFNNNTPTINPLLLSLNDIVNASRNGDDVQLAIAIGKRDRLIEEKATIKVIDEQVIPLKIKMEDMVNTNISYETLRRELKANIDFMCKARGDFRTPWIEFYRFLFDNGYNLESRRTHNLKKIYEQTEVLGEQIESLNENVIYELEKEIKEYKRNTIEYKAVREQINEAKDKVKKIQAENRKLLSEFSKKEKCSKLEFIKEEEWGDIVIITRSWLEANGMDWREGLTKENNLPF